MQVDDERFLLKEFFNVESVSAIARAVHQTHPAFSVDRFLADVFTDGWGGLALKARMRHIAEALHTQLPADYRAALDVLLAAAPHLTDIGFAAMVLSDYVEAYGTDDWEASVPALAELTKVVSAEFAIRPFIVSDQARTLDRMLAWASHEDPAVRRLASEGSRPRLPWGMRLADLVDDPQPLIPILTALRSDPDEAVRRSVANSVNDIAKDHPDIAVEIVAAWSESPDDHFPALRNHALRTLVKQGDARAMALLGYSPDVDVEITELVVEPVSVAVGDTATMRLVVTTRETRSVPVLIDYVIHYVKADGTTSPKVFKLKTLELDPKSPVTLRRKLNFSQRSTRTHRPGRHRVDIQVNGIVRARAEFDLTD